MGCLQSWVLAFIPYGDQFFLQQEHYVVLVFLRSQTEKDPAHMRSHGEIHFVLIFCFLLFDDGTADQHFRYVVCNKVCPYFLFDILWLVRMVVAQADRIFQFAERGFNRPSSVVEGLDPFRREFFPWEIRHDTFAEPSPMGNLTIRKASVYVSREPYSIKSKADAWSIKRL